jgi:ABC-type antimicrobial peptide transport system permease subunit
MNKMIRLLTQVTKGLTNNLTRTILTTLGIVIGIAMVILVLSAGEGFRSYIISQIEAFGTNTVFIETRIPPTTKARSGGSGLEGQAGSQAVAITSLKKRDVDDIKRLPNISGAYGVVIGQKVAAYKDAKKNSLIWGSDADRFNIDSGKLVAGRPYTEQENLAAAQVAVLGYQIALDLFKNEDPIGKTVRIDKYNFVVIGTYERRGGLGATNTDANIFVPLVTAQKKLLGIDYLFMAVAQLEDQDKAEATAEDIRTVLRSNHDITDPVKDDFMVTTQAAGLETLGTILSAVSFLLIAVAAISLIVGGVGIMNIMYVVVTERTAEIGLKKALGAKNSDIINEFLLEAVLLTLIGGVIGICLGAGLAYLVAVIANSQNFAWAFKVPLISIVLGLGVAMGIGIVFGVFPARKAGKMDPIEALRHE